MANFKFVYDIYNEKSGIVHFRETSKIRARRLRKIYNQNHSKAVYLIAKIAISEDLIDDDMK